MKRILLSVCCILFGGGMLVAEARIYYVSTVGDNGGPGTLAQPWRTVSYACGSSSGVAAGDTIMIREGNYPEAVSPEISGTAGNPIVVMAYPGETVSLDPGRFRFNPGVNYWKLDGLHLLNSDDNGVFVPTGTHPVGFLTIVNCEISHHKENGICLIGPDFGGVTIEDCIIEWNGEINGQPSGTEGTGICMYGGRGKIWARRNWIAFNWAKGISHGTEADWEADSSVVDSNYVIDNYESGMDWWGDNSFIRYNYFSLNGTRDTEAEEWGDKGLALDNYASGNIVAFNVIKSSGRHELDPRGSNNKFYNNTIIKDHYYTAVPGSPYAAAIIFWAGNGTGNEFRNNLIINLCSQPEHHFCIIAETYTNYTSQIWSNNLYWAPNSTATPPYDKPFKLYGAPGSTYKTLEEIQALWPDQEVGSLWADPEFSSLPDSILTLLSSSPAIDAGMDLGYPFQGEAPDMGRYEYDQGNTPPWIDPPVQGFITDEDVEFTYDLTPHEHDAEQTGEDLIWSAEGLDSSLATVSVDAATDLLTINPLPDQFGSDDFTLRLIDGQGGQTSQSVSLTVNPVNDPPWVEPSIPDLVTVEDSVFTYDLSVHEHDIEQPPEELTWSLHDLDSTLATAQISDATDLLTIIPQPDQFGSDDFRLYLSDGQGGLDSQQVTLTVTAVNDPPYIDPALPDLATAEDSVLIFDLSSYEHDPEQPPGELVWSLGDLDPSLASGVVDSASDLLTITPLPDQFGTDDFRLYLSDGQGGLDSQQVTLTVTAVNDPPYIDPALPDLATVEDSVLIFDLSSYEHDPEQPPGELVWSLGDLDPSLASGVVDSASDLLTITPQPDQFGSDDFRLYLSDGQGGLDSQSVYLQVSAVNDTPWIDPVIPDQLLTNYLPFTLSLFNYGHDLEDPPEDLNWDISDVDTTLFSAVIDPLTKELKITPVMGAAGGDQVLITLRDTENAATDQTLEITLINGGVPPDPPDIGGVPDVYQPVGFDPAPLDLRDYVIPGTAPFDSLSFIPTVWDTAGGAPDLNVYVKVGMLYIAAPESTWEGSRMVAVKVLDPFGLSDEDTLQVTYSPINSGSSFPDAKGMETWYIVEPDQTVHGETFTVHIANFVPQPGFVAFQMKGGQIDSWQDAEGNDEFQFPLISDSTNYLQLRTRYINGSYGAPKGVVITEDSTPPAPPSGLSVKKKETENPPASGGTD